MKILLYVPADHEAVAHIARGSAFVGTPEPDNRVRIQYEGAVFGQVNMRTLADRALHAYGRLIARYPTSSLAVVPAGALIEVGTYDPDSQTIEPLDPEAEQRIATWLDQDQLDPAELRPGS